MLDVKDYLFKLTDEQKSSLIAEDVNISDSEKESTLVIFESAVNEQVSSIFKDMESDFEERLESQIDEHAKDTNEKIDGYLKYVVENWKEENEDEIRSSITSGLNDKFIEGMKALFAECYMEVPADRVDALQSVSDELEAQTVKFDALFEEKVRVEKELFEAKRALIAESLTKELAETDKERAFSLMDNIVTEDVEQFTKEAKIILESRFTVRDDNDEIVDESKKTTQPKTKIDNIIDQVLAFNL